MAKNNNNLHAAKTAKNDEFYTLLPDIEKELNHYKDFFNGKIVYCNCDDPRESNFFKFFSLNFERLGLKKLITTGYKKDGHGVVFVYDGDKNENRMADEDEVVVTELQGDGSYDSEECVEFLKECDVVVTNPPFSLFREYVKQLMDYNKKFLIIGNGNAVTYKEIFPYIKNNKLWIGASKGIGGKFTFEVPQSYSGNFVSEINGKRIAQVNNACWFTNIPHEKRNRPLGLWKKYDANEYPKYDNYDAIDSKTDYIPEDYYGVIGVPITFLDKYCPDQFEIVKFRYGNDGKDLCVNGKCPYFRILIRRKDHLEPADSETAGGEEMESIRGFMEEDRKVPCGMEANLERAKGLVRDEDLKEYGKVADVRFHDIYRGMEMDAMLDIAEAYRDGGVSAAKEAFDGQNHSGMSARITAGLVARFVDEGLGKYLYEA